MLLYEEALGYAVGRDARDKDGITAALDRAAACALARQGRALWNVLDDLARAHGAHVTSNGSVRLEGIRCPGTHASPPARLDREPPRRLAALEVLDSDRPGSGVLRLWLADNTRVVLRPSGTETKFKYYCEAVEPVAPRENPEEARAHARRSGPS